MEPTYITFVSPYGGLGLRAKSAEKARARLDTLLARCATDVALECVELTVWEPCPYSLVQAIHGPGRCSAYGSTSSVPPEGPAALATAHGHALGSVAAEAWSMSGPPSTLSYCVDSATATQIGWEWQAKNASIGKITATYASWCDFLGRHQKLKRNDYSAMVVVRCWWTFRLVSSAGEPAESHYPRSKILAHISGAHPSAFLDLVFPYDVVDQPFVLDYRAVCNALDLKLPPGRFRLASPSKKGPGYRRLQKLPAFS